MFLICVTPRLLLSGWFGVEQPPPVLAHHQRRVDARLQLDELEGLGDVVVGAELHAADLPVHLSRGFGLTKFASAKITP